MQSLTLPANWTSTRTRLLFFQSKPPFTISSFILRPLISHVYSRFNSIFFCSLESRSQYRIFRIGMKNKMKNVKRICLVAWTPWKIALRDKKSERPPQSIIVRYSGVTFSLHTFFLFRNGVDLFSCITFIVCHTFSWKINWLLHRLKAIFGLWIIRSTHNISDFSSSPLQWESGRDHRRKSVLIVSIAIGNCL